MSVYYAQGRGARLLQVDIRFLLYMFQREHHGVAGVGAQHDFTEHGVVAVILGVGAVRLVLGSSLVPMLSIAWAPRVVAVSIHCRLSLALPATVPASVWPLSSPLHPAAMRPPRVLDSLPSLLARKSGARA